MSKPLSYRTKPFVGSSELNRAIALCRADPLGSVQRLGLSPSRGKREGAHLRFRCVAHRETEPSLTVTIEGQNKGLVKCFGCGLSGWFKLWCAICGLNGEPRPEQITDFCRAVGVEVRPRQSASFRSWTQTGTWSPNIIE